MKDEHASQLIETVHEHGRALGGDLVLLKRYLEARQQEQQAFLRGLQTASDAAQARAAKAAVWSAVAAAAAALAAIVQAVAALG